MSSQLSCAICGFHEIAHCDVDPGVRVNRLRHRATIGHDFTPSTRPEPDPAGRCVLWAEDPARPFTETCLTHGVPEDAGHAFATGRLSTLD